MKEHARDIHLGFSLAYQYACYIGAIIDNKFPINIKVFKPEFELNENFINFKFNFSNKSPDAKINNPNFVKDKEYKENEEVEPETFPVHLSTSMKVCVPKIIFNKDSVSDDENDKGTIPFVKTVPGTACCSGNGKLFKIRFKILARSL